MIEFCVFFTRKCVGNVTRKVLQLCSREAQNGQRRI